MSSAPLSQPTPFTCPSCGVWLNAQKELCPHCGGQIMEEAEPNFSRFARVRAVLGVMGCVVFTVLSAHTAVENLIGSGGDSMVVIMSGLKSVFGLRVAACSQPFWGDW